MIRLVAAIALTFASEIAASDVDVEVIKEITSHEVVFLGEIQRSPDYRIIPKTVFRGDLKKVGQEYFQIGKKSPQFKQGGEVLFLLWKNGDIYQWSYSLVGKDRRVIVTAKGVAKRVDRDKLAQWLKRQPRE